ncbi:GntR family transcriptional regulator [Saccharospirillum sp. MSK14-1]|uniref:GntR family transcriptional regulator n=1 Tax=Saccharospirillum sp. MSK14-1 TaxID=1897632 RepID=UPI000D379CA5|nr:GntR family transcriptional regulator [Saccharospirillum sp. MSK14-1]
MSDFPVTTEEELPLYEQMRNALIYGSYEPGQKLKIDVLKRDFSAGQNAIREALVRLSVEGLVVAEDQKGFRVAPAGLNELKDLAYMRNLLESEAVGHSIDVGDLEWEGRVAAAMRKLHRTEEALLNNETSVELWTRYDQEFHLALMSACGSKLMIRTYQDLFLKYRQYVVRELKTQGFRGREIIAEHLAIGEAALARDKQRCLALLRDHANTYLNRQLKQERH